MRVNEGALDRVIRVVLGLGALLAFAMIGVNAATVVLAVFGVWLVVTGASGFCPGYLLLRINTTGKHDVRHGAHPA